MMKRRPCQAGGKNLVQNRVKGRKGENMDTLITVARGWAIGAAIAANACVVFALLWLGVEALAKKVSKNPPSK